MHCNLYVGKASEAAHFVGLVDTFFFYVMNVHNYTQGAKSLKRFQIHFKSSDDFRLQVILLCAQLCNINFFFCGSKMFSRVSGLVGKLCSRETWMLDQITKKRRE